MSLAPTSLMCKKGFYVIFFIGVSHVKKQMMMHLSQRSQGEGRYVKNKSAINPSCIYLLDVECSPSTTTEK